MLAIPIDKLLQRMDEIEKESLNGVARWRKLREQLEDEAAQHRLALDPPSALVCSCGSVAGIHCDWCPCANAAGK